MQNILEACMLIAFSAGWYLSVARMLCTGIAAGQNVSFATLVCVGYAAGTGAKLTEFVTTGVLDPIVWLYGWNVTVVLFDLWLVIHLTRRALAAQPCVVARSD